MDRGTDSSAAAQRVCGCTGGTLLPTAESMQRPHNRSWQQPNASRTRHTAPAVLAVCSSLHLMAHTTMATCLSPLISRTHLLPARESAHQRGVEAVAREQHQRLLGCKLAGSTHEAGGAAHRLLRPRLNVVDLQVGRVSRTLMPVMLRLAGKQAECRRRGGRGANESRAMQLQHVHPAPSLTSLKCRIVSRFCSALAPLPPAAALLKMRRCRRARRAGGAAAQLPGRRRPCREAGAGGRDRSFDRCTMQVGRPQARQPGRAGQGQRGPGLTAKASPVVPLSP